MKGIKKREEKSTKFQVTGHFSLMQVLIVGLCQLLGRAGLWKRSVRGQGSNVNEKEQCYLYQSWNEATVRGEHVTKELFIVIQQGSNVHRRSVLFNLEGSFKNRIWKSF